MNQNRRALVELNFAVILFGMTAILGALISLSALEIVWWRLLITCLSLLVIVPVVQQSRGLSFKQWMIFGSIGWIVAAHWLTFYGAIKLANASTALVCFATTAFFTSMIEPVVMRQRFQWRQLLLGLLIVPSMVLVTKATPVAYYQGIALGVVSAFLASLFATLNKKYIHKASTLLITFIELSAGLVFLSIIILIISAVDQDWHMSWPSSYDILYLVILGLLCTTLAYALALRALRHISAFGANLMINLEPVYGIALAYFILEDRNELSPSFYLGALSIVVIVLAYFMILRPSSR